MFCKSCGKEITQESKFCRFCGKKINDASERDGDSIQSNSGKENSLDEDRLTKIKAGNRRYYIKKAVKILLYIVIGIIFLISWSIRKEIIIGFVPALVHFGVFYFIFMLVKHRVYPMI